MKPLFNHTPLTEYSQGKVLFIQKPFRWTSFDVVKKIRILTKVSKVGHAGTLDPLATGLLIVCTGTFTKNIQSFMCLEKEYTGSFTLGATTPTYDLESEPVNVLPTAHITEEAIVQTTQLFTGSILQMPPLYSAIKKDGKPAYLSARRGETISLEPRPVFISEFVITKIALPQVEFKVVCSTGTYIRSLANDFGKALGCGAYLSSLCRTRIGNYTLENAQTIEQLEKEITALRMLI